MYLHSSLSSTVTKDSVPAEGRNFSTINRTGQCMLSLLNLYILYQAGRHLVLSKAPAHYNEHNYITNLNSAKTNRRWNDWPSFHSWEKNKTSFFSLRKTTPNESSLKTKKPEDEKNIKKKKNPRFYQNLTTFNSLYVSGKTFVFSKLSRLGEH